MKIGKKKTTGPIGIEISRNTIHKFLYDIMTETLNDGLTYDDNAKNEGITEQEFNDVLNEYRLYGNLFGLNFITKLMNTLDEMIKENFEEKEEK